MIAALDRRRRAAIVIAVALSIAACSGGESASLAQGVVVATHVDGASRVGSFTLREGDGTVLTLDIGTLQVDAGSFDAPHLTVHQVTAAPVIVEYHVEDGRNVVFRLSDAPRDP